MREVDVLVVGAGQAGLASAYHLQRRGFVGDADADGRAGDRPRTYLVLDDEDGPGGAWQHRWESLTMATVNGIHDLPGARLVDVDPAEPARSSLTRYFARYEKEQDLAVLRPARVRAVHRADADPGGRLLAESTAGRWAARAVISATGTWNHPFWPWYPGRDSFLGRQLHTHDYNGPEELAGQSVVIVGGGISGVSHLAEISRVARTIWCTRREPVFRATPFDAEAGRQVERAVAARVAAGLLPLSVVSQTDLLRTAEVRDAERRGALVRRPMFRRIEPHGVRWADGTAEEVDVILWATGFRADLTHLAPLRLRTPAGGIVMAGTRVVAEPRLHLVGYGPAASTVGASRAARRAVVEIEALLDA